MDAEFWQSVIGGLIGSGIATTVLGALLLRRSERIATEVRSQRAYQEAALEQLFGPLKMQLGRTNRAFERWTKRRQGSAHIETNIIRESNVRARDLLLGKGHLIPSDLLEPAHALIEHFDAWLEKYEEERVKRSSDAPFVFVGTDGLPFPKSAERKMIDHADSLQEALYGKPRLTG